MSKVTDELRNSEEAKGYREVVVQRLALESLLFTQRQALYLDEVTTDDMIETSQQLSALLAEEEMWRALLFTRIFNANFHVDFDFKDVPIEFKFGTATHDR